MRKKANKADIEFIQNHNELSAEEISKEIDLAESEVMLYLEKAKSTMVLKSTRTKIPGVHVLSEMAADVAPKRQVDKNPSIFRYDTGK